MRVGVSSFRFVFVLGLQGLAAGCADSDDAAGGPGAEDVAAGRWRAYQGAWFSIEYPADFDVVPSLASEDGDGFDSVFFEAPDSGARFYVLSPLWGRQASDVAFSPERETEISRAESADVDYSRSTRLLRANDGAYTRELEEYTGLDGTTNWVFEFRYADDDARRRYSARFQRFKSSLQQYSD